VRISCSGLGISVLMSATRSGRAREMFPPHATSEQLIGGHERHAEHDERTE